MLLFLHYNSKVLCRNFNEIEKKNGLGERRIPFRLFKKEAKVIKNSSRDSKEVMFNSFFCQQLKGNFRFFSCLICKRLLINCLRFILNFAEVFFFN